MTRGKKTTAVDQNLAFKYRIYPTDEQIVMFHKTFGCCRKVWNLMLDAKNRHYQETGKNLSITPAAFKGEYPYLAEVDSYALCNTQLDLQQAFSVFFKGLKKKGARRPGRPKFKSKRKSRKSYTTNFSHGNIEVFNDGIRLPKVGIVKAKIHRKASAEYELKSATVRENPDGSFEVSVLYEYPQGVSHKVVSHIGLDYKSDGLYVDSNGECADMPHFYRQSEKQLRRERRKLSRRIGAGKGETPSKNYEKQRKKTAKLQRHTANQRKDFLHRESAAITKQYDLVSVEDLSLQGMSQGLNLGKATHDNGYRMFVDMLEYKQKREGHFLQKVSRWYPSSQTCSHCGTINPQMKNLNNRTLHCTHCGAVIDRDLNAARNMDTEGLRLLCDP